MTRPKKYQIAGVNRIADFKGRALLADEMGLGKTFQALMYADLNVKARPVVAVCPASLKWNWQHECLKHFGIRAEVLEGLKPPRAKRLMKPAPVLIINFDILYKWLRYLDKLDPQLVIVDECHNIKHRKARKTKAVKKLCAGVPHVVMLGGTPITNRPAEFFEQLHILRPDVFESRRHFHFHYCDPYKGQFGWEFKGATNTAELHKLLKKTCMIRRLKKDVLKELPQKQRQIIALPLSKPQEYKKASKDLIGWLRKISPGRALRASRAKQMVRAGYLLRLAAELKLPAVFDWVDNFLENSTEKIILVGIHKVIIEALHKRYSKQSVVIDGKAKTHKRHQLTLKFNNDKQTRVCIAQLHVAIGWNATAASNIAFVEHGYVPAIDEQAIDRIHRIGQTKQCTAYFLVAKDTIEERLCMIKRGKMKNVNAVLDGGDAGEDYTAFDELITDLRKKGKAS